MEKYFIASDHAGFELKKKIIQTLKGWNVEDLGPADDQSVDYPDYAHRLAHKLTESQKDPGAKSWGILICGSGQGMAMAANKHKGIRAALCFSEESAKLAREHNDANVLCLGARLVDESTNLKILKRFFETPFSGGRHEGRVQKISP